MTWVGGGGEVWSGAPTEIYIDYDSFGMRLTQAIMLPSRFLTLNPSCWILDASFPLRNPAVLHRSLVHFEIGRTCKMLAAVKKLDAKLKNLCSLHC